MARLPRPSRLTDCLRWEREHQREDHHRDCGCPDDRHRGRTDRHHGRGNTRSLEFNHLEADDFSAGHHDRDPHDHDSDDERTDDNDFNDHDERRWREPRQLAGVCSGRVTLRPASSPAREVRYIRWALLRFGRRSEGR